MISDSLYAQLVRSMEDCAPQEMCGFIVSINGKQRWREASNIAADPIQDFVIDPKDYLEAEKAGKILAIVHSHPNGPAEFSPADTTGCERSGLPWLLLIPGQRQVLSKFPSTYELPVIGRQWCHGLVDCYTTVRDYFSRVHAIDLPDFEREDDWWDKGQNLYLDLIEGVGFAKVEGQPQEGDVMLFSIRADVPNHAAVYLGEDEMLHHYVNQLSRRSTIGGWWRDRLHGFYRHKNLES